MIGWAERNTLDASARKAWRFAANLVASLPYDTIDGVEIRCHELARAINPFICQNGASFKVQDGRLYAIEHTWLAMHDGYGPILDVYTPGRIPQVQLLDAHFCVARGYEPQAILRTDIRMHVVERLASDMRKVLRAAGGFLP